MRRPESGDTLVYMPGLRYAILRWIWGRPGPAGGWHLHLPGQPGGQVLRPPRRGTPPQEVQEWLEAALTEHGWDQVDPKPWAFLTKPPLFHLKIPVIPHRNPGDHGR